MQSNLLLTKFSSVFPPQQAASLAASLRRTPLVWNQLQDPAFFDLAIERIGPQFELWAPGYLALLAVDPALALRKTMSGVLARLMTPVRQKALQVYEEALQTGKEPATLREAGLLAVALSERRRLTKTWSGLAAEICLRVSVEQAVSTWSTALCCLFSWAEEPEALLVEVSPKSELHPGMEWASAMVLSQPVDEAIQAAFFQKAMGKLPANLQLSWLKFLSQNGNENLVRSVSQALVTDQAGLQSTSIKADLERMDSTRLAEHALALQQLATYFQLSGSRSQAQGLMKASLKALAHWQAGLKLQAESLGLAPDGEAQAIAIGSLLDLLGESNRLSSELGTLLVSYPEALARIELVPNVSSDPCLEMRKALQVSRTDLAVAQEMAQRASKSWLDLQNRVLEDGGEFVFEWKPLEWVRALIHLDLKSEALTCLEAALRERPGDAEMIYQAAVLHQEVGDPALGLKNAELAVLLKPARAAYREHYARALLAAGQEEIAYRQLEEAVRLVDTPSTENLLDLARLAYKVGQPQRASEVCDLLLGEMPDAAEVQLLKGRSLVALGQLDDAIVYFNRVTLLVPDQADSWLILAQLQQQAGDEARALETLRAAVMANPNSVEILTALSRIYLQNGAYSDALPFLQKAFSLAPGSIDIAAQLALAQRTLGRINDARRTLESVRDQWLERPEVAFIYAEISLEQKDALASLSALELAMRASNPEVRWYVVYARLLIESLDAGEDTYFARLLKAEETLMTALKLRSNDPQALFWMAEVLRLKGEHERALGIYRQLVDEPELMSSEWNWRVQAGLGLSALALRQSEAAVAALREAVTVRPNLMHLQRSLAEAYLQAGLIQEASNTAQEVVQLAPDSVQTLAWYAEMMIRTAHEDRAAEALGCAVEINPQRADLWSELAQLHISLGNLDRARACLATLRKLDTARVEELRQAAYGYMRLQEPEAALQCLERALTVNPDQSASLLFETACLYQSLGDLESGLNVLQQAFTLTPNDDLILILQADIQAGLGRSQAALASLEKVLTLEESGMARQAEDRRSYQPTIRPNQRGMSKLAYVHARIAELQQANGNLGEALIHAEKALELCPTQLSLRLQVADLAAAMMQPDRARMAIRERDTMSAQALAHSILSSGGTEEEKLALLGLYAELEMEDGRSHEAVTLVEAALKQLPEDAGLVALQVCLLAQQGDFRTAELYYSVCHLQENQTAGSVLERLRLLWLTEAALAVGAWGDGLGALKQYAQNHATEPRAHFRLARALARCAEIENSCRALRCVVHAPGSESAGENRFHEFEAEIDAASLATHSVEIERWKARGRMAFNPVPANVRLPQAARLTAGDCAAWIAGLRQANVRSPMEEVEEFLGNPEVLLQLALYLADMDGVKALELAEEASERLPSSALYSAAVAYLAEKQSKYHTALQAIEQSLNIWGDEFTWHAWAGALGEKCGDLKASVYHWQKAFDMQPDSFEVALQYGLALYQSGETKPAVEVLEKAVALDHNRAEAWIALADACWKAGDLVAARQNAAHALELEPASPRALLLNGQLAFELRDVAGALELGRLGVNRNPENADLALFLARVLVYELRYVDALEVLDGVRPENGHSVPLQLERARLMRKLDGLPAATAFLQELSRITPNDPEVLYLLALYLEEAGDLRGAEQAGLAAVRLDAVHAGLNRLLGRLEYHLGQLDQAVFFLTEAIRLSPEDLESYLCLAQVYQQRREHLYALRTYQQAIKISPQDSRPYYEAALLLKESKDYTGAENMLRRAAALAPDDVNVRRQLGAVIALNLVYSSREETPVL